MIQQQTLNSSEKTYDEVLEQSLINLALNTPSIALECESDCFFISENKLIWESISRCQQNGLNVDSIIVSNDVKINNQIDCLDYLLVISAENVPAENAASYMRLLKEYTYTRKAISTSSLMREISTANITQEQKRENLESAVKSLSDAVPHTSKTLTAAEAMKQNAQMMMSYQNGDVSPIKTDFDDIDNILRSLFPGDLVVVAGRPGMGKTCLGVNIAMNIASQYDAGAMIFSLEMPASQLGGRMACSMANISTTTMRDSNLTASEWGRYNQAIEKIVELPIYIDDKSGISTQYIRSTLTAHKRDLTKTPVKFVLVDYIQIMKSTSGSSRYDKITDIIGELKSIAKDFGVIVMALSQLSRDVEKRVDKRPMISDLRESGAIEQDADAIMMCYRDDYYHKDSACPGTAEIIIAKNRSGSPGVAVLGFIGKYSRFENINSQSSQFVPF